MTLGTSGALLPTAGLTLSNGAVLVNGTGAAISTPVLALGAEGIFRVNGSNTLNVNSRITGGSGLTKTGSGEMTLSKLEEYTGATTVNQGTLKFATVLGNNPLLVTVTSGNPSAPTLNINGGTLDLNGNKLLVGSIQSSNTLAGGGGTLTNTAAGSPVTITTYSGGPTFGGTITGNLNLTISNSGTNVTTLTAPQTYPGATIVRGGFLILQDQGALYSGLTTPTQLANASLELNFTRLYLYNTGLTPGANLSLARLPSDSSFNITLNSAGIATTSIVGGIRGGPGPSGDYTTNLGSVTVNTGYNNIGLTGFDPGPTGSTATMNIANLKNSAGGGILNLYGGGTGGGAWGLAQTNLSQRIFVSQVNNVSAPVGFLAPWVTTSNYADFLYNTASNGVVPYSQTNLGSAGYDGALGTGKVTNGVGAAIPAATTQLVRAIKGGTFTFANDTTSILNIESGGVIGSPVG